METIKHPLRITLGQNIKRARNERNFSQEKLAELSGLHRTYISAIERGIRNVSIDNIQKISSALGVEPYLLLIHQTNGDHYEQSGRN